jgi:LysM repeat protein
MLDLGFGAEGRSSCLLLGLQDDARTHFTFSHPDHRCHAERRPQVVDVEFQDEYCLATKHVSCPRFQMAVRRSAGPGADEAIAAVPTRDVPLSPAGAVRREAESLDWSQAGAMMDPDSFPDEDAVEPALVEPAPGESVEPALVEPALVEPAPGESVEPAPAPVGSPSWTSWAFPTDTGAPPATPGIVSSADNGGPELPPSLPARITQPGEMSPVDAPVQMRMRQSGSGSDTPVAQPRSHGRPRRLVAGFVRTTALLSLLAVAALAAGYGLAIVTARLLESQAVAVVVSPSAATPAATVATLTASALPSPTRSVTTPTKPPSAAPTTSPSPKPRVHVVKAGETLSVIATHYGVSIQAIIEANSLQNPNLLYVGQKLTIPPRPVSPSPSG